MNSAAVFSLLECFDEKHRQLGGRSLFDLEEARSALCEQTGEGYYVPSSDEARARTESFPHSGSKGIYFFFTHDLDRLLYVGQTREAIGKRLWHHLQRPRYEDGKLSYPDAFAGRWGEWKDTQWRHDVKGARFAIVAIPVERDYDYYAPAIEAFLLDRLGDDQLILNKRR